MQLILTIFMLLFCSNAQAAELLVQATDSPFDKGAKKGDVIVVRPDGHEWGKEEGLPRYIVVKLPGVKVEDAKKYEEQLTEQVEKVVDGKTEVTQEMVRLRKYNVGTSVVDTSKTALKSTYEVSSKNVTTFVNSIAEKSLTAEKAAISESVK